MPGKSQESQLFDEAEFSKKLKFHQSDMVYFDGLSGAEGIGESKAAKIELTVQESMSVIFYKLLNMANRISVSEEKQLNYYSELLKTPVETSDEKKASSSLQTTSSFLSIKLFNRKVRSFLFFLFFCSSCSCFSQDKPACCSSSTAINCLCF